MRSSSSSTHTANGAAGSSSRFRRPRSFELIDGVKVVPLRRIPDERGTIYHMLKRTDAHFKAFGEIYFSTVYQGVVKGWHRHKNMTLSYACIHGRVKLVMYDDHIPYDWAIKQH